MEVTVVKLRHLGKKLSADEVKSAQQHHGFMSINYRHLKNSTEDRRVKELTLRSANTDSSPMVICLQDAEQTKLKGYEMVYVGRELVSNRSRPRNSIATHVDQLLAPDEPHGGHRSAIGSIRKPGL